MKPIFIKDESREPHISLIKELAPLLHPGVQIICESESLYIGFLHRGVEVRSDSPECLRELAMALGDCNGRRTLSDLDLHWKKKSLNFENVATADLRSRNIAHGLLKKLESENLLSMVEPIIKPRSESELIYRARSQPEIDLALFTSAREESSHGNSSGGAVSYGAVGYGTIKERGDRSVLIFGENRLSFLLASLLHGTGFGPVKIIDRESGFASQGRARLLNVSNSRVRQDEVIGLNFRSEDVGESHTDLLTKLRRTSALNYESAKKDLPFPTRPDFIITTEVTHPDYSQRWMSEAIPHLQVSGLIEKFVEVGPLVIPGKSACLRCIALAESEANLLYRKIEIRNSLERSRELPAAAVAMIAGVVVLEVNNFLNTQRSSLLGAKASFDLLNTSGPEMQYWAPHKRCGCIRHTDLAS